MKPRTVPYEELIQAIDLVLADLGSAPTNLTP